MHRLGTQTKTRLETIDRGDELFLTVAGLVFNCETRLPVYQFHGRPPRLRRSGESGLQIDHKLMDGGTDHDDYGGVDQACITRSLDRELLRGGPSRLRLVEDRQDVDRDPVTGDRLTINV